MTTLLDKWLKAIDEGELVGAVFLDLCKASDVLHHKLLLQKLQKYRFSYSSLHWLTSYLTDRQQGPLVKAEPADRAGWLGLWIGQQGREVYKTFVWQENEQDNPDIILGKLETYIRPRTNKRVARFKACQRKQTEGENFDNFVKDLRLLLMDCDYGNTEDILIDLIISGVKHSKVQERMLDKGSDLTIAKAIEIGQQFELSQKLTQNDSWRRNSTRQ
ncbi:Hypothetical predicted protein [Mytilus galloprovincialis]|uniref:Retrotransposon gag domain-containing protein n=1 Tax=Mytilus galloprovincialis TaxID=29158 RepID=A0A8B6H2I8_MYTGA|nr:Hypothetical predicted protein [Mytilus galloprovincialis]